MPMLSDYQAFGGRHYETGTLHNVLAYQGVITPHTGQPISEALLLGVSGGIAFGYFTFEYRGYLPHLVLLTHNTFDPLETIYDRLALPHEVFQTSSEEKGVRNLLDVLESGRPAIVWADLASLPYNDLPHDEQHWNIVPVVVYGVQDGTAYLADRSGHPIQVDAAALTRARGRIKKYKYRVVALDTPHMNHLSAAVSKGIQDCINLFTEAPPKGARHNFGLAGLQHWANMLTNTRNKQSWARYFPAGERLWMALVGDQTQPGAYGFIAQGQGNSAERGMYADFLDEAATILDNSGLQDAAKSFRQSEKAWAQLADMLLPDDVAPLKEAKTLIDRKRRVFVEKGSDGISEIKAINQQLNALRASAGKEFPMSDAQVTAFREGLAAQVMVVHDIEREAVDCLQSAMS